MVHFQFLREWFCFCFRARNGLFVMGIFCCFCRLEWKAVVYGISSTVIHFSKTSQFDTVVCLLYNSENMMV